MADSNTTENTPAPDKRDTTTDEPVTTLAQVDANTTKADAKAISGADLDKNDSQQQRDAYDSVMFERDKAKGKDVEEVPPHLRTGPGSFGV